MKTISQTTLNRLLALARHPKADMPIGDMLRMCERDDIDFEEYAATLTLQLALIDAMDAYSKERRAAGENQADVMCKATGTSAVAVASLTFDEPMPGADVATMVANDVIYAFAGFLAPRMNWIEPPEPPKRPTLDGNTTRN